MVPSAPAATPATMPAAPAREKLNVAAVPVPSTPPAAPEPASVLTVHDEKGLPIHVSGVLGDGVGVTVGVPDRVGVMLAVTDGVGVVLAGHMNWLMVCALVDA